MNVQEPRRPLSRLAAVGGRTRRSLLACLIALGIAGCGSDDGTIPENQSSDLLALLDSVRSNADSGDCDVAANTAQEFVNRVDQLPSEVDADVRDELDKAATNLDQLASDQCKEPETGASGIGGVQPTEETSTVEEETSTTTTTEEEPETSTTTTTDEEPPTQEPPGNQGDQGGPGEPVTPPTGDQGQQGGGPGGGVSPPSGGVGAGGSAG
jgi:hypothetical protein